MPHCGGHFRVLSEAHLDQRAGVMKNVFITGTSSGLGLATAVTLAKSGFRVFATIRSLDKRAALDKALADSDATATILPLDVTDETAIEVTVAKVVAEAGSIDALVNNAGFAMGGFVEDFSLAEIRAQMETNFFGTVALIKAVLPFMRKQRSGRIVNISSIGGRLGNPIVAPYVASKFAVEGFSEALALEAELFGVRMVLIEPGAFKTEIFESNRRMAAHALDPASPYAALIPQIDKKIDEMVRKYAGDPQKVADAVLHALTVEKPRLRYLVGTDAKLTGNLHRFLGFEAYAALFRRLFGWKEIGATLHQSSSA
jgi:NAD(P)-dependent dehydrogenase (short-subunit alcohol dehydrogenase family)